jgi:hypothetical protein
MHDGLGDAVLDALADDVEVGLDQALCKLIKLRDDAVSNNGHVLPDLVTQNELKKTSRMMGVNFIKHFRPKMEHKT